MSNETLIQGLQISDPRLYQFLMALLGDLTGIQDELHPIEEQIAAIIAPAPIPAIPTNFTHEFLYNPGNTYSHAIKLSWTNPDFNALQWEVRKRALNDLTSDWDTASFVFRTSTLQGIIDPIQVGTTRYLIKSMNAQGVYSATAATRDIVVYGLGAPTLTGTPVGITVQLSWTHPYSLFQITKYELYRDGVLIGNLSGTTTFISIIEHSGATIDYKLRARNIVGDYSRYASVRVVVLAKPYYSRRTLISSNLELQSGGGVDVDSVTFTDTVYSPAADLIDDPVGLTNYPKLLSGQDDAQTWQAHFTANGWTNFSDAVASIYSIFSQPAINNSFYEEVTDYNTLIPADVVVTISYAFEEVVSAVTISFAIEFSTDGISWTAPVFGTTFHPKLDFRYTRVTVSFGGTAFDYAWFYNLVVEVAQRTDMLRPAQILASQNDYAPGETLVLFLNSDADYDITGLVAGLLDGEERIIINNGSFNLTLKHEDAGSVAANRFTGQGSADILLKPGFAAHLVYDLLATRWLGIPE